MRCDICGTEFFGNNGICPGCGYCAGRDSRSNGYPAYQMPVNQAQPGGYNNGIPYTPAYPNGTPQNAVKVRKFSFLLVGILIILGAGILAFSFTSNKDTEYDFGAFTITLPGSMKQVNESKFASLFQSYGGEAGEYENRNVRFAYGYADIYSANSSASTRTIIDSIASTYKTYDGYEEVFKSDDVLKFKAESDNTMCYCHFKTVLDNGRFYYLFLVCQDSQRSTYQSKFDNYLDSFKIK